MDIFCEPKRANKLEQQEDSSKQYMLILYNDDYHTFDYVIDCLMIICGHDEEQATQCTYLAHYKGSCPVAEGSFSEMIEMRDGLIDKGLKATVENSK